MTPILQADNLVLRAGDGKLLVDQVSLTLTAGEMVGVIGPNGAGKSSLVKLLTGLKQATAGTLLLDGEDLRHQNPEHRARRIGYLEQRPHLYWPLSVTQVVALARLIHNDGEAVSGQKAIAAAMQAVGIDGLAQRQFLQLSEGEKLLVNMARMMAAQPGIIIADEPTAALDPAHQLQVMCLLQQQAQAGAAVLLVLHDLTLAARYCDRLLLMHNGSIMAAGTPAEVLTQEHLRAVYQLEAQLDVATHTVIIDPLCEYKL